MGLNKFIVVFFLGATIAFFSIINVSSGEVNSVPVKPIISDPDSTGEDYQKFAISRSGKLMAFSESADENEDLLYIWNLEKNILVHEIRIPFFVDSIIFHPNEKIIFIGGSDLCDEVCDGYVSSYSLVTGKLIKSVIEEPGAEPGYGTPLALSADGKYLVSGAGTKHIRNSSNLGILKNIVCETDGDYACPFAISPSANVLAVGYHDNFVRLFDLRTRKTIGKLDCGIPVWELNFSSDGKYLIAQGEDYDTDGEEGEYSSDDYGGGYIYKYWNITTGKLMTTYKCRGCFNNDFLPNTLNAFIMILPLSYPREGKATILMVDINNAKVLNKFYPITTEIEEFERPYLFLGNGDKIFSLETNHANIIETANWRKSAELRFLSGGKWIFYSVDGAVELSPGAEKYVSNYEAIKPFIKNGLLYKLFSNTKELK